MINPPSKQPLSLSPVSGPSQIGSKIGFDFDGTLSELLPKGFKPPTGSVVVTGRGPEKSEDTKSFLGKHGYQDMPVHYGDSKGDPEAAAKFKASKIQELGLQVFYENESKQVQLLRQTLPNVKIVHVKPGGKISSPTQ